MPKNKIVLEAEFTHLKTTKNTHRFEEVNDPSAIGSLYIQKWKLTPNGEEAPKRIRVVVEEA